MATIRPVGTSNPCRAVDFAHPALANLGGDPVVSDGLSDRSYLVTSSFESRRRRSARGQSDATRIAIVLCGVRTPARTTL